jgi:DNA-binding response OmpR family regulator
METIIIQETDAGVLDVLTIALQLEGFEVYSLTAIDGNLLALIADNRPRAIVLDFEFNDFICIQFCQRIKKKHPHLPILTISCNSNINQEYNKYGFDGCIEKPFDLNLLYQTLKKHIPKQAF